MRKPTFRQLTAIGSAGAIAIGTLAFASAPAQAEGTILGADSPDAIPGSYFVNLDSELSTSDVTSFADTYNADITSEWNFIDAFAAEMTEADAKQIAADPAVDFVEQNAIATIDEEGVQENPPSWGLDRVDQEELPLDDQYAYPNQGTGVTVYVIDSGMNLTHNEFTDRLVPGYDAIDEGGDADDCRGHGTHVGGTIGGTDTGVAKNVSLSPVRVLDCDGSGPWDKIIDGIEWATEDMSGPALSNMSLGGDYNETVNAAVEASLAEGMIHVNSSGNNDDSACNYSPGSADGIISVNSTTDTDARSDFSNYGECSDIFAPGSDIYAPYIDGDDSFTTMSGTSMSSPHAAGAAALYLSENPDASQDDVLEALQSAATPDQVTDPGSDDTPNLMLNVTGLG